jgi:hypothetical protein
MHPYRPAALGIAAALAAGLATMFFHPTGQDVTRVAGAGGSNMLVTGLHAMAIIAQPLIVCGMIALTAMLGMRKPVPVAALVFFCMSSVAILIEATASGFLAPLVVRGFGAADELQRNAMMADLRYTGQLNQSFASIQLLLGCVAIGLWSWAAWRDRTVARTVAIVGFVVAVGLLVGRLSGNLSLDIHGYTLVVVAQAIWFGAVAVALWRYRAVSPAT